MSSFEFECLMKSHEHEMNFQYLPELERILQAEYNHGHNKVRAGRFVDRMYKDLNCIWSHRIKDTSYRASAPRPDPEDPRKTELRIRLKGNLVWVTEDAICAFVKGWGCATNKPLYYVIFSAVKFEILFFAENPTETAASLYKTGLLTTIFES